MLDLNTWVIFLTAAAALAFAPGPGMLYVLSRTIAGGKSVGIASTMGAACGGLIHVFGAAIGVSAILATSAIAFSIIKYLGAAFLIYLGLKILLSAFDRSNDKPEVFTDKNENEIKSAFYQGIVSEFLNPKTAIFFLAFIPQFINPSQGNVFSQFIVLGLIVVLLNAIPDLLIAFLSGPVQRMWKSGSSIRFVQQLVSGFCLIALGIYLALSGVNKTSLVRTG
ncbi:MAG: LysE family translocator [Gammaproteobacteria bacterium]|nr:LysE family translocator [Gammaproteobacteria bacterium]